MAAPPESHGGVPASGVEPVAVVGLALRVPGAADAGQFWRNLVDGVESVTWFGRDEQLARGASPEDLADPGWVPAEPYLEQFDGFDAELFGMTAREAELTDPQQRIFLELAHAALADAAHDPARYRGAVGVYGGTGGNLYHWQNLARNRKIWSAERGSLGLAVGNSPNYLATSVSYRLDLSGPSLTVLTACSSSLVALHLACEGLRSGDCDLALAGGVSVELPHGVGYLGSEGFLSPDGHCRPFDAGANGTLWGSGGGVTVLKRLSDAVADGDCVRAVVLGNAVSNDGATKVGFSAPSVSGQTQAIAQAVALAGVDPRSIGYVEAHGTGTAMGDPIEVAALSEVYGRGTGERGWCGLGSVKSNIGHLSQAAGIVGLIKAVLALEHRLIPPTVNVERPNPAADFAATPFYVATALSTWPAGGAARRAGVSSFGIGGTNVHVVLEEAPAAARPPHRPRPAHLLRLSAASPPALQALCERLADHLDGRPGGPDDRYLADVAHTLRLGWPALPHRAAVTVTDPTDAARALREPRRRCTGQAGSPPPVAMLFPGQGAQHPEMGAGLYEAEPVFAAVVDECAELLLPALGEDIRPLLFAAGDAGARLAETRYAQPALFLTGYALTRLWAHWGVRPAAMIGHSIGEYVAATVAGVFGLADALRVVAGRGRLMQALPPGAMLAVQLDEAELAGRLPPRVGIAAVNGPGVTVVAGPVDAVESLAGALREQGIGCRRLRTTRAFHSPMMEPVLAGFADLVAGVPRHPPAVRFISNVTGDWISDAEATDPAYWARHLRQPVRFGPGVATLLGAGPWTLLECGPGRQLAGLVRLQLGRGGPAPLRSLPGPGERGEDLPAMYEAAGALWCAGADLDPETCGAPGRRVPLPPYPYQRRRYWVDPDPPAAAGPGAAAPSGSVGPLPVDDWYAVATWRQLPPEPAGGEPLDRCVAFVDGDRGEDLLGQLRAAGVEVVAVRPGGRFQAAPDGFRIRPAERADYDALVGALAAGSGVPARLVHAWAADPPGPGGAGDGVPAGADPAGAAGAQREQERGFLSALALVQALAVAGAAGLRLDLLTAGTEDVLGPDLVRPEHATLAGIERVVPLEIRGLAVARTDLDPHAPVPAELLAHLCRPGRAGVVALRGARRWVRDFQQFHLAAGRAGGLRERGRYLITGGYGGIGLTIAEDLARAVSARLVLVGRAGLPPEETWDEYPAGAGGTDRTARTIEAIRRIRRAGGQVLTATADVTDRDALRRVREEVLAAYGGLEGIVHAAGVAGGGMAEVTGRATAERVLAPKLAGTLALREAFGDLATDFVALCSSVTALTGGFGQVDYCAANAFLDAHARAARPGWRVRPVSLNWGGWREVGMAAQSPAPAGFRELQRGGSRLPVEHPLVDTATRSNDGTVSCYARLSARTHWVLDEHRIGGVPVVPGTAHLEAARAAAQAGLARPGEKYRLELRDVEFLEPLPVPDRETADYLVRVAADGEFTVLGGEGGTRAHVRGGASWVVPAGPEPDPPTVDIDAIRARCRSAPGTGGRAGMVRLGPRWSALREHLVGEGEELALVEAPEPAAADLDDWVLHPALLDVATAFGSGRGNGSYLPLGYGRVVVHAPLPARFYSYLRYRGSGTGVLTADLALLDPAGRRLVRIDEFVLRQVDAAAVTGGLTAASGAGGLSGAAGAGPDAPAGADRSGIVPAEGAEAFRRVIAGDPGPQVVVSPTPVDELFDPHARVTAETIEDQSTGLAGPAVPPAGSGDANVPPRTELEATIAAVWQNLLGLDRLGVTDDFFDLGGNSLVAVQVVGQTRKAVGVRIPIRSLFEAPTVAGLAAEVERLRGGQPAVPDGPGTGPDDPGGPDTGSAIPRRPRP
jgi:phthiocerol/phenolphthiocerol synthesis type-I polyketide synthase E